jgi:hypothetical protein
MKTKEEPLTPDFPSRDTEPFRVPDGYFEGLTNRILSSLPAPPADASQPPTVSLMEKVKPLIYLAAAFLGMVLLFKGLSALRPADRTTEQPLYVQHATTPSDEASDEADFLDYLEAQYADLFFSDDINEWE